MPYEPWPDELDPRTQKLLDDIEDYLAKFRKASHEAYDVEKLVEALKVIAETFQLAFKNLKEEFSNAEMAAKLYTLAEEYEYLRLVDKDHDDYGDGYREPIRATVYEVINQTARGPP